MNTTTTRNSSFAKKPRVAASRTQTIHVEFTDGAAESVAIAGTFNDWRPEATPMIAVGGGRWLKDLTLAPGTYEYCLVVNGVKWLTDPQADETVSNPFGGRNSVMKIPDPRKHP